MEKPEKKMEGMKGVATPKKKNESKTPNKWA